MGDILFLQQFVHSAQGGLNFLFRRLHGFLAKAVQNYKLFAVMQAIKEAVVAGTKFPQPAFDTPRVRHGERGSKFFQQAQGV